MADNGSGGFGDLWNDFIGGLEDLWDTSDPPAPWVRCVMELSRIPVTDPQYAIKLAECRGAPGAPTLGGGTPGTSNPVPDIESDISDFLGSILGGVTGDFDDLLDNLQDRLRDAIAGVARAGITTTGNVGDIAGAILGGVGSTAQGTISTVGQVGQNVLGQIGGSSRNALDIVGLTAGSVIEGVGTVVDSVTADIGQYIDDFLRKIREAVVSMVNTISQSVSQSLQSAISTITRVVDGIVTTIESTVRNAIESVTEMFGRIVDSVRDLVASAVNKVEEVAERVFNAVTEIVGNIRDSLVEAFDKITTFIGDQIKNAGEFIQQATDSLQEIGHGLLEEANAVYESISNGINGAIDALVGAAGGALDNLSQALGTVEGTIREAFANVGPVLEGVIASSPLGLAAQGAVGLQQALQQITTIRFESPEDDIRQILSSIGVSEPAIQRILTMTKNIFTDNVLLRGLFLIYIAIIIAQGFAQQVASAAGIKALQDVQPGFPLALPDAGAIQEFQRLDLMTDDQAKLVYQKAGFDVENAERLSHLRQRQAEIGVVQVWYLRGFIDADKAKQKLGYLGFDAADQQRLLDMSFFIPPPSDLITMAVRDVFDPVIPKQFGQFDDFPVQFQTYAKQQGISEEWAKFYWAAHWALPSATMGFEMLHRRIITEDQLKLLLRAHDVMPFWRDKLVQLSYNPLTRVDVRRMHKLGVLSDSEVKNAYLDIGYNPENAERLLQFTKQLNKHEDTTDPKSLEDLTRSTVTELYRKHTLTRNQAKELLLALGIGAGAADLFLDVVDINREVEDREAKTKIIVDQAKLGILTFAEASDKLAALGLEPLEVQRALTDLQRARDSNTKIPTHQELDKLLQAKLIPDAVYIDTMIRNGYSIVWSERFLELAKKG